MLKNLCSGLLAGLMLFAFSLPALAQEASPSYHREFSLGLGLGSGPSQRRLLYRHIGEKSTTRYTLNLSSVTDNGWLNIDEVAENTEFTSTRYGVGVALGIGKEWTEKLGDKLAIYYGGGIRAFYNYELRTDGSRGVDGGTTLFENKNQQLSHSPGVGMDLFAGIRYYVHPRIALSVEGGPGMSVAYESQLLTNSQVLYPGTPDEIREQIYRRNGTIKTRLWLLSPVYLQVGFSF
jgi:hypothetical protein